jgi:hypothetical protein
VGEVAHELIVVDTGSTDETPLIATRYGARGIALDFTMADFSRARNYAIERARPLDPGAHLFLGISLLLCKPDLAAARADFKEPLKLRRSRIVPPTRPSKLAGAVRHSSGQPILAAGRFGHHAPLATEPVASVAAHRAGCAPSLKTPWAASSAAIARSRDTEGKESRNSSRL